MQNLKAKFHIEEMRLNHLDDVMEIESLCYGEHHWSRDSFAGELDNDVSRYICAINTEGKCIGYMGIWKIFDEAHITNLAVHPLFQRAGVAHLLLIDALEDCYKSEVKFITLEVRVSNNKAQKLYEKFGFKSLGSRKNYYQDNNEDALIMWTENIFSEKYKLLYNENKAHLAELLGADE